MTSGLHKQSKGGCKLGKQSNKQSMLQNYSLLFTIITYIFHSHNYRHKKKKISPLTVLKYKR